MTGLLVETCGPLTSLQDRGRIGFQRYGVSPAGAIDPLLLAAANALVGQPAEAGAIEFCGAGGSFRVEGAPLHIAVVGIDCPWSVDGRAIPPLTAAVAAPGERIVVAPRAGIYAYFAVAGGFRAQVDMGSVSVHRRSGLGGRPLRTGDRLAAEASDLGPVRRLDMSLDHESGPIRVMLGPQDDYFTAAAVATLLGETYRISAEADRMGCRLAGPPLAHAQGYNIVSDGIATGAIQVPGDGQPIVLLRDRQTTGGYPKIATVIGADIARFAQMGTGTDLRFRAVTLEEAVAAAREAQARIAALPQALIPADAVLSSERLLGLNLIGGVSDALAPQRE